jgi:hypothetical protein
MERDGGFAVGGQPAVLLTGSPVLALVGFPTLAHFGDSQVRFLDCNFQVLYIVEL